MSRRARTPSRMLWRAGTAILAAAAVLAAGCGSGSSGTVTASRYSSARQVVAALDHAGLKCTGVYYGTPEVAGASSTAACNFGYSASVVIDVFPGTLSAGVVLQNSTSTGPERIWNVAGPNWSVQTSHYYAGRAQAILGGRLIEGKVQPYTPYDSAPATPAAPACDISGWESAGYEGTVSADLQQLNSDTQAGDPQAMAADGTTLYNDALVALHHLPPKCAGHLRHDVKLQMLFFGIAGAAVKVSVLDPAGPSRDYRIAGRALRHATHYTGRVQADENSLGY